ncbi:hypothetical protein [Halosolutus gelatinilyticus]|uniref:hypothetical protein n=1 Tax=Halosolutus gelatinilyticus TaxID=2931975 RepID=UPI001FF36BF5|nr:hypothetical protein [Halosolutus gelatinilyticus]
MHASENGGLINITLMSGVILEGKRRLSPSVRQKMQTREINKRCTDAPTGVTGRLADDTLVTGSDPAGSYEEQRVSSPLLWTTTPTGFLAVSDVEITNEVLENGEGEEEV